MEKSSPQYRLADIQRQMVKVEAMNLTVSALTGLRAAGMAQTDALAVIQGLNRADFYKSMTTNFDHRIWQDVYHGKWKEIGLYIKFQRAGDYFVISFKEL